MPCGLFARASHAVCRWLMKQDTQVADVLEYAADKAIESFLPVVLELLSSLLEADRKALLTKQPGAHAAPARLFTTP